MLEEEVDESFYISEEKTEKLIKELNKVISNNNKEIKQVGMLDIKGNEQIRRVYSCEGISPTLNTMQGGNRQPKIVIDKSIKNCVAKNFEKELDEIAISEKDIYQAKFVS